IAFRDPGPDHGWFLRIAEPVQSLNDGKDSALWQGAEIARDCGASHFEMIPGLAADAVDGTRIALVRENNPATQCIIERAKEAGLWFGVSSEPLNLGS
ncbi:hypothetical protein N9D37_01990, partial [Erythrobacter sp.]|nr:hypothetical protein [Erythrobacter sp.]